MCKDPQHHAYKSGPKLGKYTHWFVLVAVGAAFHFCAQCWSTRLTRVRRWAS